MAPTPQMQQAALYLREFWARMTQDQAENDFCQASCYCAEYMVQIGFFYDYGDGIYATTEKGRYWAEHSFGGEDPWLAVAVDLWAGNVPWYPEVIRECLGQDA